MRRIFLTLTFLILPLELFAYSTPRTFGGVVNFFLGLINQAIPVIFAISLVVFLWGLVQGWILQAGTEAGLERGKHMAVAGIIGLVVMSAMWGIIALAQSFFAF